MRRYDYIIVGSGLFGATFAYKATKSGKKCLVVEKRSHLGGNVYCENICGINVHKYGAHIFHTSNREVWDFVNSITPFNRYTNCPIAVNNGKLYHLPFNMNTFHELWSEVITPLQAQEKVASQVAEAIRSLNRRDPDNLEKTALCLVGKDIFETLIKDYTEKQWGRPCSELPSFIIKRLPLRFTYDNNYYDDTYQGIPIGGYNRLIDGLLQGTDCITDFDFFHDSLDDLYSMPLSDSWRSFSDKLVYTGPLDQYFHYQYGKLEWRSLEFRTRIEDTQNYQGNAVVNYTDQAHPYTRIIEHKHFESFGLNVYDNTQTVVTEEYSKEYQSGSEPYYPINDNRNNDLADSYLQLAAQEHNVIFGGRLAEYKYYDMAPVIERVLSLFNEIHDCH